MKSVSLKSKNWEIVEIFLHHFRYGLLIERNIEYGNDFLKENGFLVNLLTVKFNEKRTIILLAIKF